MMELMKTKKGRSLLVGLVRISPSLMGLNPAASAASAQARPGISGFADVRSDGSNFAQHLDRVP
jgi:hypothetical protein